MRIDGNVSRGARDSETGRSRRLQLLRAWVSDLGLSLVCVIRRTMRQCQSGEAPAREVHY